MFLSDVRLKPRVLLFGVSWHLVSLVYGKLPGVLSFEGKFCLLVARLRNSSSLDLVKVEAVQMIEFLQDDHQS